LAKQFRPKMPGESAPAPHRAPTRTALESSREPPSRSTALPAP
jgi:hypothetical protein